MPATSSSKILQLRTRGDALKVNEGDNITIRRVRTEWTNGPIQKMALRIYPCNDGVLLKVMSLSPLPMLVFTLVSPPRWLQQLLTNVAGIEVENTVGADVYNNIANNNTGGILVFNMLSVCNVATLRENDNEIHSNNTELCDPRYSSVWR